MSETIHHLKVMAPVELGVSAAILDHRYGKVARLLFDYLLVQTKMQHAVDSEGFVSVSQSRLRSLGIDTSSRRRGLLALEELGLVERRQTGQGAYRAKLLYNAPTKPKPVSRPSRKSSEPSKCTMSDYDAFE